MRPVHAPVFARVCRANKDHFLVKRQAGGPNLLAVSPPLPLQHRPLPRRRGMAPNDRSGCGGSSEGRGVRVTPPLPLHRIAARLRHIVYVVEARQPRYDSAEDRVSLKFIPIRAAFYFTKF